MNKIYSFLLTGENIDGDSIILEIDFENYEDFNDALKSAIKEAIETLESVDGGHIDIFDEDSNLITDVEV